MFAFSIPCSFNWSWTGGNTAIFSRCVALAFTAWLRDSSSASWLPCWNGVLEWPRCAWSVDGTGSCMTLPVMDQVALGETFDGSSGLSRGRSFPGDRRISLKQQACWLWYPIWYWHFHKFTPLQTALTLEYPHLCEHRDLAPPQGFEVCVSACHWWAKASIIWPLTPEQPVRMRNRPRRGEGINTCPAQQADVLWGSLWVAAGEKGQTDVKHGLVLHVVTFVSCLPLPLELRPTCCSCLDYLPTVTSVLRWKHRRNLNVNILAVDRQNEQTEQCLSLRCNHPSNERLPHHIVCWRNDHF